MVMERVVMSIAIYEEKFAQLFMYNKIIEGKVQADKGKKILWVQFVML